jgi:hypothetical protein
MVSVVLDERFSLCDHSTPLLGPRASRPQARRRRKLPFIVWRGSFRASRSLRARRPRSQEEVALKLSGDSQPNQGCCPVEAHRYRHRNHSTPLLGPRASRPQARRRRKLPFIVWRGSFRASRSLRARRLRSQEEVALKLSGDSQPNQGLLSDWGSSAPASFVSDSSA